MSLTLLKGPEYEPVSLKEAKLFLRLEGSIEDSLIEGLIRAARQAVEAYTSRCLINQSWRMTVNTGFAHARSDTAYLSRARSRGGDGISLARSPFVKLLGDPVIRHDHGSIPLKAYRLDTAGRTARLHFDVGGNAFTDQNIQIDFVAGYGENPCDVPDPLHQAILMVVAHLYENRSGVNDNPGVPGAMNEAVMQLIRPYQVMRA
jgi:hypothetical protein